MKIQQHTDNLTQLIRFGCVNAYLVREDDGLTLVDTTVKWSAKGILTAAERLGAPITRIVLTHTHADHVGSLQALVDALPDAEFGVSAREARFLAGERTLDPGEPGKKLKGGFITIEAKPTLLIAEGDRVGSLEAIATPGHSPGHLSFIDTRDRSLIAGDVFTTIAGVRSTSRVYPLFPFAGAATTDGISDLESAKKLAGIGASRMVVGHGKMIEAPEEAMRSAIRRASKG